jgi:hypothetical protein
MFNSSLSSPMRGILAAAALSAASATVQAVPVFTPNGDPFPASSTVTIDGDFSTPFGYVDFITLSNFSNSPAINPNGGSPIYTYSAHFHADFLSGVGGSVVGSYDGNSTDFMVRIDSRGGLFNIGTFNAILLSATFNGLVSTGDSLTAQLNPSILSAGTATFTGPAIVGGNFGLFADTSFGINPQYSVNGGPFVNLPQLPANSTPPAPAGVPEPATLALLAAGVAAMGARRRRAVEAAAVAA